jgi:hypothetical protein
MHVHVLFAYRAAFVGSRRIRQNGFGPICSIRGRNKREIQINARKRRGRGDEREGRKKKKSNVTARIKSTRAQK